MAWHFSQKKSDLYLNSDVDYQLQQGTPYEYGTLL